MTAHPELDFDALYRGGPLSPEGHPLRGICPGIVPWDIGGPQQPIVELETIGGFRGHILDVGCGLGDNALYLAGRGHQVTGIDISPGAINRLLLPMWSITAERAEDLG